MVKKKNKFVSGLCVFLALVVTLGAGVGVGRLFGEKDRNNNGSIDYVEQLEALEVFTTLRGVDDTSEHPINYDVTWSYDKETRILSLMMERNADFFNGVVEGVDWEKNNYIVVSYPVISSVYPDMRFNITDREFKHANIRFDNVIADDETFTLSLDKATETSDTAASFLISADDIDRGFDPVHATNFIHIEIDLFAVYLSAYGVKWTAANYSSYWNNASHQKEYNTFLTFLNARKFNFEMRFDIVSEEEYSLDMFDNIS